MRPQSSPPDPESKEGAGPTTLVAFSVSPVEQSTWAEPCLPGVGASGQKRKKPRILGSSHHQPDPLLPNPQGQSTRVRLCQCLCATGVRPCKCKECGKLFTYISSCTQLQSITLAESPVSAPNVGHSLAKAPALLYRVHTRKSLITAVTVENPLAKAPASLAFRAFTLNKDLMSVVNVGKPSA